MPIIDARSFTNKEYGENEENGQADEHWRDENEDKCQVTCDLATKRYAPPECDFFDKMPVQSPHYTSDLASDGSRINWISIKIC